MVKKIEVLTAEVFDRLALERSQEWFRSTSGPTLMILSPSEIAASLARLAHSKTVHLLAAFLGEFQRQVARLAAL